MADPRFAAWTARVDAGLAAALPDPVAAPQRLHRAMCHAVLGGGKRMRPLLVYATGHLLGADEAWLDAPAVAVELVHAYSLVHDDLPAMDDDDLRRGQPTVHVAFDEATAILAGDALQTRAFEVLAASFHPGAGDGPGDAIAGPGAALVVDWFGTLAAASGVRGMCGGQALDIDATGQQQSIASLGRMHEWKTGALIRAAVAMGAAAGGADPALRARLDGFATSLGLAFQVRDDLLDVESTSAVLGKTPGKDAAQAKSTYVTLLGLDATRAKLDALSGEMANALSGFDQRAEPLRALARLAVLRDH